MKNRRVVYLAVITVIIIHRLSANGGGIHQLSPYLKNDVKQQYHSAIVSTPADSNPEEADTQKQKASNNFPSQQQPEQQEQLLLRKDENSTIASDIVKIWHETDSKEICVALKRKNARCPHPALVGRLSGPGLAILEWNTTSRSSSSSNSTTGIIEDNGTVLCGGYGHYWLDAGDYFVEIIIVYCNDFGVSAPQRITDPTAWMEADHTLQCVEDVFRHRITSKKEPPIIHVATSTEGRGSYQLGRWVRNQDLPSRPMFTRSQPVECHGAKKGGPMHKLCVNMTTIKNEIGDMRGYEFQWKMKGFEVELAEKIRQRMSDKKIPQICAIGDSHSEYMVTKALPKLNLQGLFRYVKSIWPQPERIVNKIHDKNCDVFFSQVSQWPASHYTGGHPFSFAKYHEKLKKHVQNILKFNPNATVYLPTADQAPLMAKIVNCSDWRAPTLIDGYSYVHQMIEKELNTSQVRYIDTNFIIYTNWDGHPDWQHLSQTVRCRKTMYMAAIMLGETEWLK